VAATWRATCIDVDGGALLLSPPHLNFLFFAFNYGLILYRRVVTSSHSPATPDGGMGRMTSSQFNLDRQNQLRQP